MRKKINLKSGQSLLFACYGNTCRSPIAEGLARAFLGPGYRIESAGISIGFEGAQSEAVEVLRDLYDVDISGHRTRNIFSLELDHYDWFIILDPYVHEFILNRIRWARDSLVLWPIEDPFGQEREMYEVCAHTISNHLRRYLK